MKKESETHFSYSLEATLTDKERQASEKLEKMREEVANDHTLDLTILDFF